MASNNYGIDQNVLPAEQRLKNLQNVAYKFNVDKNQPIRRSVSTVNLHILRRNLRIENILLIQSAEIIKVILIYISSEN